MTGSIRNRIRIWILTRLPPLRNGKSELIISWMFQNFQDLKGDDSLIVFKLRDSDA